MEKNIFMQIEYDGGEFSGWQRQPGRKTIQGELERVLSELCAQDITIDGTGRTDAGVHALCQCATFSADFKIPVGHIKDAANNLLAKSRMAGGSIRILSVAEAPPGFHARFSAKGKKYIYRIYNAQDMPVFLRNYRYHVKKRLNVAEMEKALGAFTGTHDFSGFMAAGSNLKGSTVRTIFKTALTADKITSADATPAPPPPRFGNTPGKPDAAPAPHFGNTPEEAEATPTLPASCFVSAPGKPDAAPAPHFGNTSGKAFETGYDIKIEVQGDGFLYNMVRIIAGTLVDVGLGRISANEMDAVISSCDRSRAGHTAPPQGLYLAGVYF